MAVTAFWYGQGFQKTQNGTIDLDTDAFKAMLTTVSYVPNQDTDVFRSSVTNEITGTGYSAGGIALTTLALTYDAASNEIRWDYDDLVWAGATFTFQRIVVYKNRGGASTADELVMWVDCGASETVTAGTFTYTIPATGSAKTTVA